MKRILFAALLALLLPSIAQAAQSLRIGTLPVVDSLLLHVAKEEGFFRDAGLDVEIATFQSALEKDAAVQAGTLDAYLGEISGPILQRSAGLDYLIVATTYFTNRHSRMFGLVTSPALKAESVEDLRGKSVAMSRGTIIDYLLDPFLKTGGLQTRDVTERDIRKIPARVQMLLAGQVDAALLPEPLLSVVETAGGEVLLDDRQFDMPMAIIAFSRAKADPATVAAFQKAFARAAAEVNGDQAKAREALLRLKLIPESLARTFTVPYFDPEKVPYGLPDRADYESYVAWLGRLGMLPKGKDGRIEAPTYESVVFQGQRQGQTGPAGR